MPASFSESKGTFSETFHTFVFLNKDVMTLSILLIFGLGTTEILLIALVVLLLFGGKKIPELMKGLGKGVKSFKDGVKGVEDELKTGVDDDDKPADKTK
jgi:sec-independent protein translocase protein TatA